MSCCVRPGVRARASGVSLIVIPDPIQMQRIDRANGYVPGVGPLVNLGLWKGSVGAWAGLGKPQGSKWLDSSGHKNHGTLVNGPVWTPTKHRGRVMTGLGFDGNDDWVSISDSENLDLTSALSISFWMQANGLQKNRGLVNKFYGSGYIFHTHHITDNVVRWQVDANSNVVDAAVVLTDMNHIVGTWNGTIIELFVNGISRGTDTGSLGMNTHPLRIGRYVSEGTFFNGLLDDVRIYNRALTPSEIGTLAEAPYAAYECRKRPTVFVFGIGGEWKNKNKIFTSSVFYSSIFSSKTTTGKSV